MTIFFVGKMVESKKALPKEPRGGYGGYVGYPGMSGGGRMPFLPGSACVLDAQLDNSDLIEHSGWNRLIFYVHLNQKQFSTIHQFKISYDFFSYSFESGG